MFVAAKKMGIITLENAACPPPPSTLIGVGVERLRGNFTFTTAKVGPKGDPIFDDAIFDDVAAGAMG